MNQKTSDAARDVRRSSSRDGHSVSKNQLETTRICAREGASKDSGKRYARPVDTLFVQRGLARAGAVAVGDWLANATLTLVWSAATGAAVTSSFWVGSDDDDDDDGRRGRGDGARLAFYESYGASGEGRGSNASALTAAAVLVLSQRDVGADDVADAPVSEGVVILVVTLAFGLASAVALTCLALNVAAIRELRSRPVARTPPRSPRRSARRRSPTKSPARALAP